MNLDYTTRTALAAIAANLRANATTAKDAAASYDAQTDVDHNAGHWGGVAHGLMEAHGIVIAVLTAGRDPINIGDEVVFDWFDDVELPDIDAHYRVIDIANGMITVQRAIHGYRDVYPRYRAPLTAVHKTSPGHRCPALDVQATPAGGAR